MAANEVAATETICGWWLCVGVLCWGSFRARVLCRWVRCLCSCACVRWFVVSFAFVRSLGVGACFVGCFFVCFVWLLVRLVVVARGVSSFSDLKTAVSQARV